MRGENFIYFFTSSGFFVGIIFSIFHDLDFEKFLYATFLITAVFYIFALATVSFFIKFVDIKNIVYLDKKEIDKILDVQIKELEEKEDFILESYEFIKQIEEEELQHYTKRK